MAKNLEVKNLKISFRTNNGKVQAVRDISFDLERGKTLAIVGESGSGKRFRAVGKSHLELLRPGHVRNAVFDLDVRGPRPLLTHDHLFNFSRIQNPGKQRRHYRQ